MEKRSLRMLAGIGALLLMVFVVGVGPALAGGSSGYTEDNDTNDGGTANNVSDEGDNAHPSGRDRSTENGGSGNQGNSQSDPDGDTNGGADKPNGAGGTDKADQDGNNGCGNDDDFEDDNNGNCGGKAKNKDRRLPLEVCIANVHVSEHAKACHKDKGSDDETELENELETDSDADDDDDVLGGALTNDALASTDSDEVLGGTLSNADAVAAAAAARNGSFLPFTGVGIITFLTIAGLLLATGFMFTRAKRAEH